MVSRLTAGAPNASMTIAMRGTPVQSTTEAGRATPPSSPKKQSSTATTTSKKSRSRSSTGISSSEGGGAATAQQKQQQDAAAARTDNPATEIEVIFVNLNSSVQPSIIRKQNAKGLASESDIKVHFIRTNTRIVHAHHGPDKIVYLVEGAADKWDDGIWLK